METFKVNILGCGSAKPTLRHMPTAQIVDFRSKYFMIDCGEGAQVQMQRMGLAMARIGHIFITHNHGDHVFGLPGLISTMALLGRTASLYIHGPKEIEGFLRCILSTYCEGIDFSVEFLPVDTTKHSLVYEDRGIEVWNLPLKHRIPCCGYLFKEKPRLPHIRREMIDAFNIPVSQINNIKAGASWTTPDGTLLPHERLTTPAAPARSYAYCSDTCYLPQLAKLILGADPSITKPPTPRNLPCVPPKPVTAPQARLPQWPETHRPNASSSDTSAPASTTRKLCSRRLKPSSPQPSSPRKV